MTKKRFLLTIPAMALVLAVLAGCASMTVVGIDNESVKGPERVRQYGAIDPKEITVYANYKDGSRKQYSVSKNDITFDSSKAGPQTVKLTVKGYSASFQTEVMALTGITVAAQPKALKLGVMDSKWPGLEIQAAWSQMGSEKINIAECQFSGFDPDKAGKQTVTVAWHEKRTAFNVDAVAMASIRIANNPAKTTYGQGESLDLKGLKVIGVWPGLPEEEISVTSADITGYNTQSIGRQTLTITKNGKTATFGIEVVPSPNGTWVGNNGVEWRINNGIMDYYVDGRVFIRRTYTISGNTMTATTTHQNYNNQGLKTKAEILQLTAGGTIPAELIEQGFAPQTIEWSVSGNTLTLIGHDVVTSAAMPPQTYTRK